MIPTLGYLYPWDVVGDPAAADRIAALGLSGVALAGVYHATRTFTPRHPARRVVTADRSAAYFPLDTSPLGLGADPTDSFGTAAATLSAAAVPVTAWAVLLHVDGLPADPVVVNAYGDRYPYALCAANPEAIGYARTVAAAMAARPDLAALELEACGWYGYAHLHAHDKTAGVPVSAAADFLLSLCFCATCQRGYAAVGLDPRWLRTQVTGALDRTFAGEGEPGLPEWAAVEAMLGEQIAAAVLEFRDSAGDSLRAEVIGAVRAVAADLPVLLHADVRPHRSGANTGLSVPAALRVADGLVVNCWDPAASAPAVAAVAAAAAGTARVVASLLAVRGMGGAPDSLGDQLAAAAQAGATEARLYHVGLAGAADLAAVHAALA